MGTTVSAKTLASGLTGNQASSFSLQRTDEGGAQVVSVSGYIGRDECERIEKELRHLLQEKHRHVVLDGEALTFTSSASLARLLVCARNFTGTGGHLLLAGFPRAANRMAELVGFDKRTELSPDVATGLKVLSRDTTHTPGNGAGKRR